jgi:ribonuclease E
MNTRTRSGRLSKVPERLELFEEVEDDYKEDEYDSDVDLLETGDEDFLEDDDDDDEDEEYEDDSDADENGNLKDFVVDDEDNDEDYSEEEEEESESESE